MDGKGSKGAYFLLFSVCATLLATLLEIFGSCDFADDTAFTISVFNWLDAIVVIWFTFEYIARFSANGISYAFSSLGMIDLIATVPYYLLLLVPTATAFHTTLDGWDGPLRALRLLRLVSLDRYAPR